MEYWRTVVTNPTGNKATDKFAVTMDNIPKIVFSCTLKSVEWEVQSWQIGILTKKFWHSSNSQVDTFWLVVRA